jgi:WD40 repeat protein
MAALEPEERDIAARAFRYLVTRSRSKIAHSVTDLAEWTDVPPEQLELTLERLSRGDARILRPVGEGSYEIYHDVLADAILAWRASHEASKRLEEEKRLSVAALRRRVGRVALVLGVIGFAVVALLAYLAFQASQDANDQKKLAQSREFAIGAVAHGRTDQDVGLRLALAAWNRDQNRDAESALRRVLAQQPVRPPQRLRGDVKNATEATYNADGTRIIVSGSRSAELWDGEHRQRIAKLDARGFSLHPKFSADGSRVLTVAGPTDLRVLNTKDGAEVRRLPGRGDSIHAAAINHDGSLIAVKGHGRITFWKVPSGGSAGQLKVPGPSYNIEFAANSDSLIVYGGTRVTVWRPGDTRPRATVPVPEFGTVVVSPDVRRAVVFPPEGNASLRDVASGRFIAKKLPAEWSGEFSGDGRRLVTSKGSRAMIWNARNGALVRRVRARGHVDSAVLNRNGRTAALLLANGAITHWNGVNGIRTPIARAQRRTNRFVQSVDISGDGRQVVWTTTETAPSVWTIQDDNAASVRLGVEDALLTALAFAPRSDLVAGAGDDGLVRLWHLADGKPLPALPAGRKAAVATAFNDDGTLLLTADADGTARLWDVASRRPVATLRTDGTPLTDARFSADGKLVVTADAKGRTVIWRTDTARRVRTIPTGQGRLLGAAFSGDGQRLVTAHGVSARIWDVATGSPGARLDGGKRFRLSGVVPYPGAEFNRDGSRVLMVGTDGGLRLWDASGRRLLRTRGRRSSIVNHAHFSPDGRYVAAGTDNDAVDIRDADTGKLVKRLGASGSEIARVGFSPDGKSLVGMSSDGVSRVWDVASGDRLSVDGGRTPFTFYWAAFSPDGKRIVTSDGDQGVHVQRCVWCLSADELVGLAKQSAQRELTPDERREYHIDEG